MKCARRSLELYAVTGRECLTGGDFLTAVEQALAGGVTMLQLREKMLAEPQFKAEGLAVKALCQRYQVPFIVNDDVALALELDADGVHVGQSDCSLAEARRVLGPDKIIGVSATNLAEALAAEAGGADYLGVGAVFPTGSKADAVDVPFAELQKITSQVKIPVVAIGGINLSNIRSLSQSGIDGIAVISALFGAADIRRAAERLLTETQMMKTAWPQVGGVVFDLDGTLFDSMGKWGTFGADYLRSLGVTPEPDWMDQIKTLDLTGGAGYLQKHYNLAKSAAEVLADLLQMMHDFYFYEVQLKPGAETLLKALQNRHIPMVAATAGRKELAAAAFDRLGLNKYFAGLLTCDDLHCDKNTGKIFEAAQDLLASQDRSRCFVAEDALFALQSAQKSGFKTIGVYEETAKLEQAAIRRVADLYVADLADLAEGF